MAEETSIKAFNEVRQNGVLTNLRLRVYEVVCSFGPLTATEMYTHLYSGKIINSGVFSTRLSELEAMKMIQSSDTRICTITQKTAKVWKATGNTIPVPIKKKKTKKEIIIEKEEEIRLIQVSVKELEIKIKNAKSNLLEKITVFGKNIDSKLREQLGEIYRIVRDDL